MTLLVHSIGIRSMVFFAGVGVASLITLLTGIGNAVTYVAGVDDPHLHTARRSI